MASLSNPTVSGKVLKEPNNGGKMTYLDMSLDDIIILKKLESKNTESKKNGTQNRKKKNPISRQRANARRHRRQRGEVQ
uniref:Uncharacterized protein n=1 Tax=Neovison vison TaxID=452646 RepID=A0A8C7B4F6_NEOVI